MLFMVTWVGLQVGGNLQLSFVQNKINFVTAYFYLTTSKIWLLQMHTLSINNLFYCS